MKEDDRKVIEGTLCIIKVNNKYLLRLETRGINKDCWIFPGGSYERNKSGARELGIECAIRETQEETGLTPLDLRLRARIFFDNFKRIFPGKTEVATFDYDALYFYSENFRESPELRKEQGEIGWFSYEETRNLAMHKGDLRLLEELELRPQEEIFEGVVVHEGTKLEYASFHTIG